MILMVCSNRYREVETMARSLNMIVTAAFLLSFATAGATADPIEEAAAARLNGDYTKALRLLRPLADQGNATAQSSLGFMYATGQGVPLNHAEAAKWYRLAADQGRAPAQYNLGRMYAKGEGVTRDAVEAVKWWRAASEQGHSAAQFNLGIMYAEGLGVARNDVEAVKWWRAAADQGDVHALFNLGVAYANGQGVPKSIAEAAALYRRAADKGHGPAQVNLGLLYDKGGEGIPQDPVRAYMWFNLAASRGYTVGLKGRDSISKRMTPAQIAEAQKLTRGWKQAE